MQNDSGKWYMLDAEGKVVEGEDNPAAVSVLAAPGGNVPQDVVDRHGLKDRLSGEAAPMVDAGGNPVVVVDGRAVAASVLPEGHPSRPKADTPAKADEAGEKAPRKGHDAPREGSGLANAPAHGKAGHGHQDGHKAKG